MIVAKIHKVKLRYISSLQKTLAQDEFDKQLQAVSADAWEGNIQAVIANGEKKAAAMLAEQVRQHLAGRLKSLNLQAEDVEFEMRYSPVENGKFWLSLSHFNCSSYRASFEEVAA